MVNGLTTKDLRLQHFPHRRDKYRWLVNNKRLVISRVVPIIVFEFEVPNIFPDFSFIYN